MNEEEITKYIAQLAFSGAQEFVDKMNDIKSKDSKDEIIGKFGLGFYSSFMVAERVEVESLSYKEGAQAIKWTCEGDTEYEFSESSKSDVGTTITLYVNEESEDFLQTYKTRATLKQYCDFMPYPIELIDLDQRELTIQENLKATKEEDKKPIEIDIINEAEPLWKKDPSKITDEEYKTFFKKLYPMEQDPLFWLHLNIDHPFTLQGILYFPKFNPSKPFHENNIKLYSKQVFVPDNTKNIIPEFLSMLKGAIDSSDIPLNVSRSALQGDPNIKKISNYIIKKVADSLKKLSKNERERYEKSWEDIGLFSKYGVVSDNKFDEIMRDFILFKTAEDTYLTLGEYSEQIPEGYKEKLKEKVIFFEKEAADMSLVEQLKELKIPMIQTDNYLDPHLTQHIEIHSGKDDTPKYNFSSIDVEFSNLITTEETSAQDIEIQDYFKEVLDVEKNENLDLEIQKTATAKAPAYFKLDQNMKRFQQMSKGMGNNNFEMPIKKTLVVNPAHSLIKNIYSLWQHDDKKETAKKMVYYVQDLAQLSSEGLSDTQKTFFIKRSQEVLEELSKFATKS